MATILETLVVELAGDAADYKKTLQGAQSELDSFADGAKKLGGTLSLAVTAPLTAIGFSALGMASDLNETVSKVDTLFGDSAADIQSWASVSAEAFGLSSQAALDSVGTLGNMFMQLGAGNDQAATLSQGMVELSADIASFHNVAGGSQEVLDAMTSAFRGEYDALQRYIPTINAAAVQQAALAATGKTTADELTNLDKALAVQQMILTGAGAAAGDFARTSDGLANSQRILQAELANVGAELGQELLPIAVEVAGGLRDLLGWFSDLSPETKKWIVALAATAAAAGPVIGTVGAIASGIGAISGVIAGAGGATALLGGLGTALTVLTGPVGLTVAAVAGLALAWNSDFLGMKTKTLDMVDTVKAEWPGFVDGLKGQWQSFTGWVGGATSGALNETKGYFETHRDELTGIASNQWETLKGIAGLGMDATQGIVTAGFQFITGDFSGGMETLRGAADSMWGTIQGIFDSQLDNIRNLFELFGWGEIGENIATGIRDGLARGAQWIADAAREAAQAALDAAKWILGIHSPSAVAADEIGAPFAEGIGQGIDGALRNTTARIQAALDGMVGNLDLARAQATATTGAAGMTFHIYVSGREATYENGREVGRGILDELRSRGQA